MSYQKIPIGKAEADPEAQSRIIYDVKDLMKSIETVGQLEPVLAYEKGGKYYVYVGMRRLYAIKNLYETKGKPETIKAEITAELDRETKRKIIIEENSEKARKNLTVYDKIWLVWQDSPLVEEMAEEGLLSSLNSGHPNYATESRWKNCGNGMNGTRS
ncbi:MAG: ParB-like nuclease domain-containing protein [Nitrososphaerota archaeon]|jgi:ParB-like chromosome segregation protein Spo0J|nr:ParB/RepB/Spo0J family partition protein [Nitrososphaerota archaeon]MDG6931487.1 ParB-like nuclease domain-containing protein [Nitrososphaerota archaeon]MDG6936408.1 ParB-like nuclease domain-containing protein [Nitrososphaerota archaeon]MDG6944767.1 ParB-like nuclease domain-containing protein [Nitrososphaerota archaeon]